MEKPRLDNEIVLVVPYFGKLPNYFQLHLNSAAANPQVQWLLFTDDQTPFDYPVNYKCIYLSWEEMKVTIQNHFDFAVALDRPHKLCDLKPAFGYIFQAHISQFAYWGHCDLDIIWGNFANFLVPEVLRNDKIFTLGHLTIYRNSPEINELFKYELDSENYRSIFSSPKGYAFDEKNKNSINTIALAKNVELWSQNFCADVDPYKTDLRLVYYDLSSNTFTTEKYNGSVFLYRDGRILRFYTRAGRIEREEFLYIHLQKRKMKLGRGVLNQKNFRIKSNGFEEVNQELGDNLIHLKEKFFINYQWFRVKYNSLKFRIKNGQFRSLH